MGSLDGGGGGDLQGELGDGIRRSACSRPSNTNYVTPKPPPGIKQADRAKPGAHLTLRESQGGSLSFRRYAHYRIRALLYAGKPNWALLAGLTPR